MYADNSHMTPIFQHNFTLASVSYLGPAYAQPGRPPLTPQPAATGASSSGQQSAR